MKFLSWLSRLRSNGCAPPADGRGCCCCPAFSRKQRLPQTVIRKSVKEKIISILRWPVSFYGGMHKPSWLIVFQLLFAEATLPGLRNVFGFSHPFPRLVFALIFLYLIHTTVKDITELVTNYLEYNTTMQVTIEEPNRGAPMTMPAITVCNQNPILLSKFCSSANRNYIETETNKTCGSARCENFVTMFYATLCLKGAKERETLRFIFGRAQNNTAARKARQMFDVWYSSLMGFEKGRELLSILSYQSISDIISQCTFNGNNCIGHVSQTLLPTFGMCLCLYCNSSEPIMIFETHLNGLKLNLRVNEHEYMPMIPTAGHLVMIRDPDEGISVAEDTVFIHPLATTYISLQKEQTVRLLPPSKNPCTMTYPEEIAGYMSIEDHRDYSMLQCQDLCTQMEIHRQCGCVDFKFRLPKNIAATECSYVLGQNVERNEKFNDTLKCALETAKTMSAKPYRCGCIAPCQQDLYRKVNSALFWHPELQRRSLGTTESSNSTTYIFMQSNKINVRREVRKTTLKELLNSIAGTMGLYLGYSYLFAFYILDILVRGVLEIVHWHRFKARQPARFKDARLRA